MSSTSKGLRRAGVSGVAALVAIGGFIGSATIAHAAPASASIGIADSTGAHVAPTTADTVQAGATGQSLSDVQLTIPDNFKAGDTIDLALFDRSATSDSTKDAAANNPDAGQLKFSAVPSVSVTTSDTKNTRKPLITASLAQSATGNVNDIVRLTISGAAVGTPGADDTTAWNVDLKGLKVDLGANVTPGELRIVPFAYNTKDASAPSNTWFGNTPDDPNTKPNFEQVVSTYTVPAYVAPVAFNVGSPNNLVFDGTAQQVGDITVAETNDLSLQNGKYTVTLGGATVENNDNSPITVTLGGAAKGETVTVGNITGNSFDFTLAGASDTGKLSIKLSGLLAKATAQGKVTYTLSGGSVSGPSGAAAFLVEAGTGAAVSTVPADSAFGTAASQAGIDAEVTSKDAVATGPVTRLGGADRYQTAANIALHAGGNGSVVLASGENFPDALSAGYLANQVGGNILLTKQASLPAVTLDAMRKLLTNTVYVVGDSGAISDAVVKQLQNNWGVQVIRLGGADRYATNKAVNEFAASYIMSASATEQVRPNITDGSGNYITGVGRTHITFGKPLLRTAFVARGDSYADALSAGAATRGMTGDGYLPLILTKGNALSADAAAQFTDLGIQQGVIVGGADVVTDTVANSVKSLSGNSVKRLAGADRYATAAAVADFEYAAAEPSQSTTNGVTTTTDGGLGFHGTTAYLATGDSYADALAGAQLSRGDGNPILLTKTAYLSDPTRGWLAVKEDPKVNRTAWVNDVVGLGLNGAVSDSALTSAQLLVNGN